MPVTIRRATIDDIICIQNANLHNLPENYMLKYYMYHVLSWPEASFVATTTDVNQPGLEDLTLEDGAGKQIKLNSNYVAPGEKTCRLRFNQDE